MKQHPTWFNRWRRYPEACIGHLATGAGCAAFAATGHEFAAFAWLACYIGYQAMSWARKKDLEGKGDSVGLDIYDWAVGFVPTYTALIFLV